MFDPQPQPQPQGTPPPQGQVTLDDFDEMVRQRYKIPKGFWESTRSTESGGNDAAVSPTGVKGSFQVTQRTAEQYGLNRDDPYQQRVAAARYMRDLYEQERGKHGDPLKEWAAVRAKYYAGPNAVDSAGNISGDSRDKLSNPQSDMRKFVQSWGQWRKQNGDDLAEFGDTYRAQSKPQTPTATPATRPGPVRQPAQTGASPYDKLKKAPAGQPGFENPFDYRTAGQALPRDLQRRDEMVPTTPELRARQQASEEANRPTGLRETVNQLLQAGGLSVATGVRGFAELADTLGRYTPVEGEALPEYQARTARPNDALKKEVLPHVNQAEQRLREAVPIDPNDKSWWTAKIPAAIGSTLPFIVGGAMTRGSKLATAILGAAGNAGDIGKEFDAAGGDPSKRDDAILAAAGVGLTEVAGIGRLMAKFGANRGMLEVAKKVFEEGGQEGVQQWLNNLIASDVGAYDPNRPASQGVAESAALGGIVGGAFGGASSAANKVMDVRSQVQAEDAIRQEPPSTPMIRETQVAGQPRRATQIVPLDQLQQVAPRAAELGNRVTEPANLRLAELGKALAEAEAATDESTRNQALARASQLGAKLLGPDQSGGAVQAPTEEADAVLMNAAGGQPSVSEQTEIPIEERARQAYEQAVRRGQLAPVTPPPKPRVRPTVTQVDPQFAGVEAASGPVVEQHGYQPIELAEPFVAAPRSARLPVASPPANAQQASSQEPSLRPQEEAQPSLAQRAALASRQAIQQYEQTAQQARTEGRHSDALVALTAQIKALKDLQASVDRKSPGGRKLRANLEAQAQQVSELRKQVRREQVQAERVNRLAASKATRGTSAPLLNARENAGGGVPTAQPIAPNFERLAANEAQRKFNSEELEGNQSLESFVVKQGGVRRSSNNRGEVAYGAGREGGRPGFVNDKGLPVDEMRRYANEAGYGPYETEADFLDALRNARNIFSERRRMSSTLANEEESYYRNLADEAGILQINNPSVTNELPAPAAAATGLLANKANTAAEAVAPASEEVNQPPLAKSQFARLMADNREQINRLYSQPLDSLGAQSILQELRSYAEREGIEPRHLGALVDDVRNYQSDRAKSQNLREPRTPAVAPTWRRTREGNSEPLGRTGQTDELRPPTGALEGENPRPDESVRRTTDPAQLRTAELAEPPSGLLDLNNPDELPPVERTPEQRQAHFDNLSPQELDRVIDELTERRNRDIREGNLTEAEQRELREDLAVANARRKALVKLRLLPPRTSVEKPTPERIQARREANQQAGGKWQQQIEQLPRLNDETLRKRIGQAEAILDARGGRGSLRNKPLVEYLDSARAEYAERQGKQVRGTTGEIGGEQRPMRNRVPTTAELMKPRTVTHTDPKIDGKPILAETADGRVIVPNPENKGGVSVVKDQTQRLENGENPGESAESGITVQALARVFQELDTGTYITGKERWREGLQSIAKTRALFPELSKQQFDEQMLELAREGHIVLHRTDYPTGVTADERNAMVVDEKGNYYLAAGLTEKGLAEYDAKNADSKIAERSVAKSTETPVETVTPSTIEQADQVVANNNAARAVIADFGEKIGGARKDRAVKTGAKAARRTIVDERPTWRRKYEALEIIKGYQKGKWELIRDGNATQRFFDSEAEAEKAIPLYEVARNHTVSIESRAGEEKSYAIFRKISDRKRAVVKGGFASYEEAMQHMAAHAQEIIEHKFEFPEKPWLDRIEREGKPYRKGDVTPQDFQQAFGFRGGEFGNWNKGSDGQAALNHAYDALMDLADILQVPSRALSLNGELAIAFGARGHGGKDSARAHYERDRAVINLTKIRGAGSLAHEWFHALDHYLARQGGQSPSEKKADGTFATKGRETDFVTHGYQRNTEARVALVEAFNNLVKTMTAKTSETAIPEDRTLKVQGRMAEHVASEMRELKQDWMRDNSQYNRKFKAATPEQIAQWDLLAEKIISGDVGERVTIGGQGYNFRYSYQPIEDLNSLYKAVQGRSFATLDENSRGRKLFSQVRSMLEARERVAKAAAGATETRKVATDYFSAAREIDNLRSSDYWSTPHEMGARAFESYIYDKLKERGERSDYLTYGVENKFYALTGMKPYPEGAERESINGAFKQLFDTVQTEERPDGVVQLYSGIPLDFKPTYKALQDAFAEGARIARKEGVFDAAKFAGKEVSNLAKAIWLSGDIPLLRQGGMVSLPPRYWMQTARDLAAARKAWTDEGFAKMQKELERLTVEVDGRPIVIAKVAQAAGVDFTSDLFAKTATRTSVEEGYESSVARSLPVLHNLEQFNAIFMDLRRLDVFHRYLDTAFRATPMPERRYKAMKDAAELVNYLSGRAKQKEGASITNKILNLGSLLTSAKYLSSRLRLLNPRTYTRTDATVRKEVLKDFASYFFTVAAINMLAAQVGMTVSLDPDDSDFGKPVLPGRKTRYDITAGFLPLFRLFWQVGKWVTNAEEDKEKLAKDTREEALRFARGKLAPIPSYVVTALNDWTEMNGEKTTPGKAAQDRVVQMMAQDFRKAYEEEGHKGLLQTLPALISTGVQNYDRPRNQSRLEISKQPGETLALPHWRTPSPYDRTWNLKPQPDETKPEFERRRTRYESLARDAASRLEAFPGYQQADAALKERALHLLQERLSDAGKDERSNLGRLNPGVIMTSVRESELERRRKEAKERGRLRPQPNP